MTNPAVDWMESVLCSGAASCKGIQMTVTKDVPRWATNRELLIGELECESPESCRNGMFDLGTGVQFARCSCGRKSGRHLWDHPAFVQMSRFLIYCPPLWCIYTLQILNKIQ